MDFGKPGTTDANTRAAVWFPKLRRLFRRDAPGQTTLLLEISFDAEAVTDFGAPAAAWMAMRLPHGAPAIRWEVQWFHKTASRLPEALWFSVAPPVPDTARWRLRKMGRLVSPLDVVSRGGRKLHAVEEVVNADPAAPWIVRSLDAALVAPGSPRFIDFDDAQPELSGGWHFNLWNNVWGTNFPQWYEQDARFRFELELQR